MAVVWSAAVWRRVRRWFRLSRLTEVAPRQVTVTHDGLISFRVVGVAYGWVACAGRRRAVWGDFDEVFELPADTRSLVVAANGFLGRDRDELVLGPRWDLARRRAQAVLITRVRAGVSHAASVPSTRAPTVPSPTAALTPGAAAILTVRTHGLGPAIAHTKLEQRHDHVRRQLEAEQLSD